MSPYATRFRLDNCFRDRLGGQYAARVIPGSQQDFPPVPLNDDELTSVGQGHALLYLYALRRSIIGAQPSQPLEGEPQQTDGPADRRKLSKLFHNALFLQVEVGNPHTHRRLDNHDFPKCDQRPADQNVEVLAGRAVHLDDTALIQGQNVPDRHYLSIQLDENIERDVAEVSDFVNGLHRKLPLQVDRFLAEFVHCCDHPRVGLVATLQNDEVRELSRNIDGRVFNRPAEDRSAATGPR